MAPAPRAAPGREGWLWCLRFLSRKYFMEPRRVVICKLCNGGLASVTLKMRTPEGLSCVSLCRCALCSLGASWAGGHRLPLQFL